MSPVRRETPIPAAGWSMAMTEEMVQKATFGLKLGEESQNGLPNAAIGTGFFVTPDLALTALHNLTGWGSGNTRDGVYRGEKIRFLWDNHFDSEEFDIAVLRLVDKPEQLQIEPLGGGYLDGVKYDPESRWEFLSGRRVLVYGHNLTRTNKPRRIWGTIKRDPARISDEGGRLLPRLVIGCEDRERVNLDDGEVRGMSGGPVVDPMLKTAIGLLGAYAPRREGRHEYVDDLRFSELSSWLAKHPGLAVRFTSIDVHESHGVDHGEVGPPTGPEGRLRNVVSLLLARVLRMKVEIQAFRQRGRLLQGRGVWIIVSLLMLCLVAVFGFLSRRFPLAPAPTLSPQTRTPVAPGVGEFRVETLGMVLKRVPIGSFWMGSSASDPGADKDEMPRTEVGITYDFWIADREVTQAQFQKITGDNPSFFHGKREMAEGTKDFGDDPSRPVETVSWDRAADFCSKLTAKAGQPLPSGYEFRLPTEAEWEYACRAGSETAFCFGSSREALGDYAWMQQNSAGQTQVVGKKKPNAWGLYDVHGNVMEWCWDWYQEKLSGGSVTNISGPSKPDWRKWRVLRGGGWASDNPENFRCSDRWGQPSDTTGNGYGFRVVLAPSIDRLQPASSPAK